MTTIIVGDTGEGAKWWSYADWAKNQLAQQHQRNRGFMQQWHQPSPDVRVHVKMVGGSVKAWIYTEGGYEFFVPETLVDFETYTSSGQLFFNGAVAFKEKVLYSDNRSVVPNTWYSEEGLVITPGAARYRNVQFKGAAPYFYTWVGSPVVLPGGTTQGYKGHNLALGAAAKSNDYVFGVQPGSGGGNTVASVEQISTGALVYSKNITGSWPNDEVFSNSACPGYWVFNRAGNKACTVVWVNDALRFGIVYSNSSTTPHLGYVTSRVIEIEFITTVSPEGVTSFNVVTTQEFETPDFCIAADYDWSTEGNDLITAQLSGYDYQQGILGEWVDGALNKPLPEGSLESPTPWAIGDRVKTTIFEGIAKRPGHIYRVTGVTDVPGSPGVPDLPMRAGTRSFDGSVSGGTLILSDETGAVTALDVWLHLRYANGTILKTYELAHNRGTDGGVTPSNGTWYQGEDISASFATRVSGLDLRVRGMSAYSEPSGANFASVYDKEWTNGIALPATGGIPKAGNYYFPNVLYGLIKIHWIPQTIVAVPYKKMILNVDDVLIEPPLKEVAVYAPYGDPLNSTDFSKAIDFRLDLHADVDRVTNYNLTEDGKGMLKYYHQGVYSRAYPNQTPYLNRSFNNGVWAKRKNRP